MMNPFNSFLEAKPLYYKEIDHERVHKAYALLKPKIRQPLTIHVVGTNGKGSTGRYLSSYLNQIDKKVLHYSSPHIKNFNERIWINGNDVSDTILESAHKFLLSIYDDELLKILTYFEYTTLLALYLSKDVEYLVLEAGLGGEFDATNIIRNDLSLITTIDLDHQAFLGNTVKAIATTKMRSVDTKMLLGYQVHSCVKDMAYEVKKQIQNEYNKKSELTMDESNLVSWTPESMLEVTLNEPDDFLKVRETLTRIGVSSRKENKLFQSCHILHKQGRYFIVHFKELFLLDGKKSNLEENDIARRNTIAQLMSDWGLITVDNPEQIKPTAPLRQIKIIPFKEKDSWELCPKYNIGSK